MKRPRSGFPLLAPRVSLALLLALSQFAPGAAPASVYPVKPGSFQHVFGKNAKDYDFTFGHPEKRQFVPFAEQAHGEKPADTYFGSACYSDRGFDLVVFSQGERRESIPDCGGSFSLYLRPGVENTATSTAPVMLVYSLERFPAPPPGKPFPTPAHNENLTVRSEPFRFSSEMPTYGSSHVPLPAKDPSVEFCPLAKGWMIRFSFRWIDFHDRLPFSRGKLPTPWRMIVRRTRPGGTVASWGTLAEPAVLNWGRPGDSLPYKIPMVYFLEDQLGPAYHGIADFLRTYWTASRQERWMFYLDPGIPTFEPRNPDSDQAFVKALAGPILDSNANIDRALYFNYGKNIPRPPVEKYGKAEQLAIIAGLGRVFNVAENIENARRDYLLARMLGKPVPVVTVPETARPEKPGKSEGGRERDPGDLDLEDTDEPIIELDDVGF